MTRLKKILTLSLSVSALAFSVSAEAQTNPNLKKLQEFYAQQGVEMPQMAGEVKDAYIGDDSQKLKDWAKKEWLKKHPDDEVVATFIRMDDWERYQDRRWSEGSESYYNVDYSTIQVMVAVKDAADKAVLWPVNITKDHMNNEKLEIDMTAKDVGVLKQRIPLDTLEKLKN